MRIGNFVPLIACKPGFENNVSGHVQVPLHGMDLLRRAGHEVELVSNPFTDDRPAIPRVLSKEIPLHIVPDGRKRTRVVDGVGGHSGGLRPRALFRQLRGIVAISRERRFEVLHLHGSIRIAYLARLLALAGLDIPTVVTIFGSARLSRSGRILRRTLWPSRTLFVTASDHVAREIGAYGTKVTVVRHGAFRDLLAEAADTPRTERRRILFWRDPSRDNGCDVAADVYDRLAPKYPGLSFEFAIRPHWREVPGLAELAARHPNVKIHRFPYPPGITIAALVRDSLCILLPLRAMSIDPQLVLVESLAAGVPVVATNMRSNPEVIRAGITGELVPPGDVEATAAAVERIIRDPAHALEMGRAAQADVQERWNWSNYVRDIEAVYRRAIGSPSTPPSPGVALESHRT